MSDQDRQAEDGRRPRGRPPSRGRDDILTTALHLLRELGVARLTTREVAQRAGVSEGSIFYHFKDRTGLLLAVFMSGLRPLVELNAEGFARETVRATLLSFSGAVEQFLDVGLDVLMAAQADATLRDALAERMLADNLGPHRGVAALGAYLREQQLAGAIRADVSAEAVALTVLSSTFFRVSQRRMLGHHRGIPTQDEVIDNLVTMLTPSSAG